MTSESVTRKIDLSCGATLLVEPMPDVQSASVCILVPAGSIHEPSGANGTAAILSDLVTRGAGNFDSRKLAAEFDRMGAQRSEAVGWNFLSFHAALLADHLPRVLELYGLILRDARLPEQEFLPARLGVEQTLRSLDDEPQRKVLTELRRSCYDEPWGRPPEGSLDELSHITYESVVGHYRSRFGPRGTIIGVAGHVDPETIRQKLEELLAGWPLQPEMPIVRGPRGPRTRHIVHDSSQTHIGLGWPIVPHAHPDYYAAWAAVSILGGGSSSRLFTEVRERRGLCYAVSASLSSLKQEARTFIYVGTTTERAQQTLEVTIQEIEKLQDGITEQELERCKARAKSSLVMQQESTGARASSIARDWFFLDRVQSLQEVHDRVKNLTVDDVNRVIRQYPPESLVTISVGKEAVRSTRDS